MVSSFHSCVTSEWYTPKYIADMARQVLGTIDLDPASCEQANEIIRADKFYTKENNGLLQRWGGSVYVNPPGNKTGNKSNTALFWEKLMYELHDDLIDHAIFMGFSVEALAVTQNYNCKSMLEFPICIPRKRIKFEQPGLTKKSPSHSNVIVYVPGRVNVTDKFIRIFSELGVCKR